jgi:hypothetical protein
MLPVDVGLVRQLTKAASIVTYVAETRGKLR